MHPREFAFKLWQSHQKGLIIIAILLAMNAILYFGLEQILIPNLAAIEKDYIYRQSEVRQLKRNRGGTANTPEQIYAIATQELKKFEEFVPEYHDFTELIEELLVLANQSGLNIAQINYKPDRLKEIDLLRYSFSFKVTGKYAKIKKFIHTLEQSTRLLIIKQIGLTGVEGGSVVLSLSLETFFRAGENVS